MQGELQAMRASIVQSDGRQAGNQASTPLHPPPRTQSKREPGLRRLPLEDLTIDIVSIGPLQDPEGVVSAVFHASEEALAHKG